VADDLLDDISSFDIHPSQPIKTNHAAISLQLKSRCTGTGNLVDRSRRLQQHSYQGERSTKARKGIKADMVDHTAFASALPVAQNMSGWDEEGIYTISKEISNAIYRAAREASRENDSARTQRRDRWRNIIESHYPKRLWRAINWKGVFDNPADEMTRPSEESFCQHFQQLLNPSTEGGIYQVQEPKYMPLLDDPIMPNEVINAIREMKSGKAAGIDGVAPDLLKAQHGLSNGISQ
jgi:hypothetical protein